MNSPPVSFSDLKRSESNVMSLSFESEGYSPLVGKIFSLLLFASEPVSLQEMADQLGVTKAAVSVQVRTLEKNALCTKLATSSDRKDYYYISDDVNIITLRGTRQKIEIYNRHVQTTLETMETIGDLPPEERASYEAAKRRYKEAVAMYQLILSRLEGIEEEWQLVKQKLEEEA
ncbi:MULTISPECIES: GbsR/MarR family transcriptional regulator [Paenibacillus]|uniref:MarR family transcriptional regulator n=1 Tax=Paenibacillus validus TaxID=44253 RepID=A0A7X3CTN8_9BACL|nr:MULTISPECIES: MarR family transcriptional regulator [Paenibacillus]MUG72652.1 MarR family transcriptional regulator [Paenibacillus validus]